MTFKLDQPSLNQFFFLFSMQVQYFPSSVSFKQWLAWSPPYHTMRYTFTPTNTMNLLLFSLSLVSLLSSLLFSRREYFQFAILSLEFSPSSRPPFWFWKPNFNSAFYSSSQRIIPINYWAIGVISASFWTISTNLRSIRIRIISTSSKLMKTWR